MALNWLNACKYCDRDTIVVGEGEERAFSWEDFKFHGLSSRGRGPQTLMPSLYHYFHLLVSVT